MGRGVDRIEELRRQAIEELKRLGIRFMYLTCDYCEHRETCEYAYDLYNTDGDCIVIK